MQPDERQQLIAQYEDGYRAVADALLKITPEELDAKPAPGKWSAREIVHHLADSEMTAAVRFRLLLARNARDPGLRPGPLCRPSALRTAARGVAGALSFRPRRDGGVDGLPHRG